MANTTFSFCNLSYVDPRTNETVVNYVRNLVDKHGLVAYDVNGIYIAIICEDKSVVVNCVLNEYEVYDINKTIFSCYVTYVKRIGGNKKVNSSFITNIIDPFYTKVVGD